MIEKPKSQADFAAEHYGKMIEELEAENKALKESRDELLDKTSKYFDYQLNGSQIRRVIEKAQALKEKEETK